ncbi:MAG: hypothetical protein J6O61_04825 [Butyrivibrio sp.]|uniref:glycosyltransferase family 39 protein n=1 Tax=Butyrivibrio sp. TaxID=28121 RepID=UPI001B2D20BF|nr:glycosyltransferase family 39 protein [Butyrivibrio sp.]MBO6240150.1 hypothetical protein [Butyrivibrio sp.]
MNLRYFAKKHFEAIWCIITSFLVLTFTTRSSFLFPYNNWDDVNSYFTMGKGMMNGLVIYRDLYDQKGPFLYFLYGIGYLLSHNSFLGIFFFEIIAGFLFLFFAFKVIKRHSCTTVAIVFIPLLACAVYSSRSFYWGGAAEEFCLPALSYTLYILDIFMHPQNEKESELISDSKTYFTIGVLTGIVALVKYTMMGFFFSFAVISICIIISKKGLFEVLKKALFFLLGIATPIIPWLIYFGVNGALDDWYRCYIYNNLFFYSNITGNSIGLYDKFYKLAKLQYWLTLDNLEYFIWIIAAFILALFLEKHFAKKIAYIFMYASTFLVIFYGGGTLPYYSIPLTVFTIPGAAYLSELIQKKVYPRHNKEIVWCNAAVLILSISVVFAKYNCLSTDYFLTSKNDHWLTRMATQITGAPDTTLLNVGCLDVGLYTITGIVPTCEYFQTNGIALPTMFDEQQRYIDEGITEYVIAGEMEPNGIYQHYELIDSVSFFDNSYDQVYYLYKKK